VELGMNKRDQLAERSMLAVTPGLEQYGDGARTLLNGSFYV
jgi:hypothetical protein